MNATKKTNPIIVDGLTGDDELCTSCSDQYDNLYNSVLFDNDEFQKVTKTLTTGFSLRMRVIHLLLLCMILFSAKVYYIIHLHGLCPESMIIVTMIPIPKVKR